MARLLPRRPEPGPLWQTAVKACLLICLTLVLLFTAALYLADGRRIPVGSVGITVLRDVNGKPYLVVDRPQATSVMVDLSLVQGMEVYTGQVHF